MTRTVQTASEFVRVEVDSGIATIRIDRPKMNPLSIEVQDALAEAARIVTADDEVAAVVIYGGERVFAAGADITGFQRAFEEDSDEALAGARYLDFRDLPRWLEASGLSWVQLELFSELYGYVWWALARIIGYVAIPILTWKVLFREDKILDMGLHVKGFFSHLGLYAVSLAVVLIAMAILSNQRDFLTYYPFYKGASRSWLDYLSWEACYFAQFFALEFYFRGFLLQALRKKMGSAAIFAVAVPYCMIHYGKPYLEAHGAIIAGVVLGSLAMKTRSIYAGFLVHIVVAALMDYYALASRNGIPTQFLP